MHPDGDNPAIHRCDGQAVHTRMQLPDHFRIGRKGCRVVPEAVPNEFDTMFSQPLKVGAELNQRRVYVHAADAGRAAHSRLKHIKFAHRCSHEFDLCCQSAAASTP